MKVNGTVCAAAPVAAGNVYAAMDLAATKAYIASAELTAAGADLRLASNPGIRFKSGFEASDLELITEEKPTTDNKRGGGLKMTVSRDFRDEIDLRGKTGDEAWSAVDKYFDEAIMAGFSVVRLVHGKGTGALKNALWVYLKGDKRVKSFRIGRYGEGDGGVTVVELK